MLEVKGLQAGYDNLQVLWDISLKVNEGELVVLLGSNGAGKTTTLRSISGILKPLKGEISFCGQNIRGLPAHKVQMLGLSYTTEDLNLFARMTVKDNLLTGAYQVKDKHKVAQKIDYVFSIFPRLVERHSQLAGTLSGGERKMLAIGRVLMADPKLILVDEPSLGLSPILTKTTFDALKYLNSSGVTILLVEQHLSHALEIANRGYVIVQGRIALEGSAKSLLESPQVKEVYLRG
jgi:ABC-type branched-subunit amino acid transport system ATPase component